MGIISSMMIQRCSPACGRKSSGVVSWGETLPREPSRRSERWPRSIRLHGNRAQQGVPGHREQIASHRMPSQTYKEARMGHDQEYRRHQAIARYLAGDPIEAICRDLHCAKSWLYKWKVRYQADDPGWATRRSTQPRHTPNQTPQPVAQRIVTLHRTLVQSGQRGSAAAIQQALQQQGLEPVPSLRTISRILQRHAQEAI